MFKNPFSFQGRIRRTEFIISIIICKVFGLTFNIIQNIYFYKIPQILGLIIVTPLFWFLFAQGAKRCHDRGNNGWYQFIPFYIFVMLLGNSECGVNQFGPNPKNLIKQNR
ncbi:DUF805 domain-containing protein [Mesoflavibacter sp. CH_XMU1422-2]|uniref:DUF805 domain-containing protein n=1 Tax=Mesoflavibacter sp. CH_XMU1422-2 TaxID=3107770 RepID=UPI003009ECE9